MADIYIGNVKGPQGDTGATGPQGAAGDAATIQVGTVSTTAYGNPAQVSNSGTEHEAVFNFVIPQGAPGATVTQLDNLALNTITTSTDQYPQIQVGDLGRVIFGKIIKFFQDLVTGLAAKVNYSDALTMEEIEASSDLTDKVSAAAASKSLKDALSTLDAEISDITAIDRGYFNFSSYGLNDAIARAAATWSDGYYWGNMQISGGSYEIMAHRYSWGLSGIALAYGSGTAYRFYCGTASGSTPSVVAI